MYIGFLDRAWLATSSQRHVTKKKGVSTVGSSQFLAHTSPPLSSYDWIGPCHTFLASETYSSLLEEHDHGEDSGQTCHLPIPWETNLHTTNLDRFNNLTRRLGGFHFPEFGHGTVIARIKFFTKKEKRVNTRTCHFINKVKAKKVFSSSSNRQILLLRTKKELVCLRRKGIFFA